MRRCLLSLLMLAACSGPDLHGLMADTDADDAETGAEDHRATHWFPLDDGNTWTLESGASRRTLAVTYVAGPRKLLAGLFQQDAWLAIASDDSFGVHRWDGSAWLPFLKFGLTRSPWVPLEDPCVSALAVRTATDRQVDTPAGSFTQTVSIGFSSQGAGCALGDVAEVTFAADVGPVALKTTRGEQFSLVKGTVHGAAVTGNGVSTALAFDSATYVHTGSTPTVAHAVFTLSNSSNEPRTWTFGTSCIVDIELQTLSGHVVRHTGKGPQCTPGDAELTVPAQSSKDLVLDVPLADTEGIELDGAFTAVARLQSSHGPGSPAASTSFTVAPGP